MSASKKESFFKELRTEKLSDENGYDNHQAKDVTKQTPDLALFSFDNSAFCKKTHCPLPSSEDIKYMSIALDLAKEGWGNTSPNPLVGAVLVKNGKIIGKGYHKRDTCAHAEIECLKSATESSEGATIYVTLEPCSTSGRTGACSTAIINAKIAEVKIGTLDPNPAHKGKALDIFKSNNIKCQWGILENECQELNLAFNYSIVKKQAFLALKYAISADGKITKKQGTPTAITNQKSKENVMHWRRYFSAIGVGYGTLLADNPSLTARENEIEICPIRLIFDASLKLAKSPQNLKKYKVFSDRYAHRTFVVCDKFADKNDEEILNINSIKTIRISRSKNDSEEFWDELKSRLYSMRIISLYIEGGAEIIDSVCLSKKADFAFEYQSSATLGEGLNAFKNKRNFEFLTPKICHFDTDKLTYGKILFK